MRLREAGAAVIFEDMLELPALLGMPTPEA
jgi:hypothetical protein